MKNVNPKGVFSYKGEWTYVFVVKELRELAFFDVHAEIVADEEHKQPGQKGKVIGRKEFS